MIRNAVALLLFIFLFGWHRQTPGVVLPYDHPANPHAQAAPPIVVPPIEGPDIEPVPPDVGMEGAKPAPAMQPPTPNDAAAPHQHHH
jgi:hypothetical protein